MIDACQELADVSIHALLAECDLLMSGMMDNLINGFNPRTPCGVRLFICHYFFSVEPFQSTHSLRSATLQIHGGVP